VNVAIAGAHGQIALRLARLLAGGGDRVIGLIRDPGHAAEVSQAGAFPVLCDLERAGVEGIVTAIEGADAVVFAAGAGPRPTTMTRRASSSGAKATSAPWQISRSARERPPRARHLARRHGPEVISMGRPPPLASATPRLHT
jgi:nucleoside-diphosphate-sugar epimerase